MTIKGCDVSAWQGDIDWLILSTRGLDFAYMRGAYGTSRDSRFVANWNAARSIVKRGVYLYFLASQNVKAQVDVIIDQVDGDWGEKPPALDVEYIESSDGAINNPAKFPDYLERVTAALQMFDEASGVSAVFYSRYTIVIQYLPRPDDSSARYAIWCALGDRLLWIAHYASNPLLRLPAPTIPLPWADWWMWQFSAKGNRMAHYYGIQGSHDLDLDLMRQDFQVPEPEPPEPPTPPPVVQKWLVTADKLNVRAEPYSGSTDLGDLRKGDVITEIKRKVDLDDLWIYHSGGWSAAIYRVTDTQLDVYMEAL